MYQLFTFNNLILTSSLLLSLIAATPLRAAETIHYDQINLSAISEGAVNNDILLVQLQAIDENKSIQHASQAVNTTLDWALKQIEMVDNIQAKTLRYQSTPIYKNKKISAWRVRQSIQLESTDTVKLANLIGSLQKKMILNSVQHQVSLPAKQAIEAQLTTQALTRFKNKAELIVKTLGAKGYRIVRLNIGSSRQQPVHPVAMRAESFGTKSAAPSFKTGSQTVRITVDGTIQLSR